MKLNKSKKAWLIVLIAAALLIAVPSVYVILNLNHMSKNAVGTVKGSPDISYDSPALEESDGEDSAGGEDEEPDISQETQSDIYLKGAHDKNVINILVLGSDSRDLNSRHGRSDTMVLLSYNRATRKANMISFLRDTLVPIDGHGWSKLNHAFAYGGVGLCINTINANFDLDIQKYVLVDFDSVIALVDYIGGVDIKLTEKEADYYVKNYGWDVSSGLNHLDGEKALLFSRLRAIDNDFERTRRQRAVLSAIYQKIADSFGIDRIPALFSFICSKVETNLSPTEILSLATNVLSGHVDIADSHIPEDNTWKNAKYEGMSVLDVDIGKNKEYLHTLIWGEDKSGDASSAD